MAERCLSLLQELTDTKKTSGVLSTYAGFRAREALAVFIIETIRLLDPAVVGKALRSFQIIEMLADLPGRKRSDFGIEAGSSTANSGCGSLCTK